MESLVTKYWSHIAAPQILYFSRGWYYFCFESKEDMEKIRSDVWNLNGYPLVFKEWSPTIVEQLQVTHIPVWVLLPNLDPCFWSQAALSKVASTIGNPICADEHTTNKTKLAFARILVDVDLSKELPNAVKLSTPYRGIVLQKIEYEWLPYFCSTCQRIGHTKDRCPKLKPKMAYKPKAKESSAAASQHMKAVDQPTKALNTAPLSAFGFEVLQASNVEVAPEQTQTIRVDLVDSGGGTFFHESICMEH
ncbi:uncharacterized protein At4g02000-like [Silene latifolia]|uniref:uncharacterized protein At4g02000-like n=1 Tax=Silene latifolia TaxID=37657 RepID=UPI003D76BBA8